MASEFADKAETTHVDEGDLKAPPATAIRQQHAEIYREALERYPSDESIDQAAERRVRRKIDMRILPLLGICYFFYVSES